MRRAFYLDISYKTLYHTFYSDLITPVANGISVENTQIFCLYGMCENTSKLTKRYQQHFQNATLIGLADMHHEELLANYPEQWVELIVFLYQKQQSKILILQYATSVC